VSWRTEALERVDAAWIGGAGGIGQSSWWREWSQGIEGAGVEVVRVGRRGGKSTMLCRLAVAELLWTPARTPAGDVLHVAIVSVDRREAAERLRTIGAMLDALGVVDRRAQVGGLALGVTERKSSAEAIELAGDWGVRAVRVFTATVAGVSGMTCSLALCDEVAKWRDRETGRVVGVSRLFRLNSSLAHRALYALSHGATDRLAA